MPGVVRYLSYKDIPPEGSNYFYPNAEPEEVFCSNQILYAGQVLGLILAGK